MSRQVLNWLPATAVALLIFLLSHQSEPPGSVVTEFLSDWILHFAAYGVLGGCLVWGATDGLRRHLTGKAALLILLAAMLYGVSDEWHQSWIPGRTASAGDWLADALGASASILSWLFCQDSLLRLMKGRRD